ncbi:MAG TPA: hypothetical protein VK816_08130, partial [Jatrophihabitantaceae bacterium]|nr:hypothetical protein [Jatrophihabitantaceae bacterium]
TAQASLGHPVTDIFRQRLNSTIAIYGPQEEWIAQGNVPTELIYSATEYVRNVSTGAITAGRVIINPGYVAGQAAWGTAAPLVPRPANPTAFAYPLDLNYSDTSSSNGSSVDSLMFCPLSSASTWREKRDAALDEAEVICTHPTRNVLVGSGPAYDMKRELAVMISTPYGWSTDCAGTGGRHCFNVPKYCDDPALRRATSKPVEPAQLMVHCAKNAEFTYYRILLGAGGAANTYVDTHYDEVVQNKVGITADDIHDQYHNDLLSHHYYLTDVFADSAAWWSNVNVLPEFS